MYYTLVVSDGYVIGVASSDKPFQNNIAEEEANSIKQRFLDKPSAPDGYDYMMDATTLEWVLVEITLQPEPEVDANEAMEILFGDN